MDSVLKQIQGLIVRGDEIAAKAQLLEYLDIYPNSADSWWLVSLLADNDSDAQLALKRCLECDGTHYDAKRALGKLKQQVKTSGQELSHDIKAPPKTAQPKPSARSTPKAKNEAPSVMNGVVAYYVKKGWEIKNFSPQQVAIQKTTGLAWGFAIIIAVIIPVFGWIVFLGNLFLRRRHEITLNYIPINQRVQITGRSVPNVQVDWNSIQNGRLPEPTTNYFGAFIGGTIVMLVLCSAFIAFVVAFGSNVNTFEVGDVVYIDHPATGNCHRVYRTASYSNPYSTTYPNGQSVVIEEMRKNENNETWYRISVDNDVLGWIPAEFLAETQPTLTTPRSFCQ